MPIPSNSPIFTQKIAPDFVLRNETIDIWQFSLKTAPQNYLDILNEEEIKRAERFHFPIHRKRNLAAHTTVRKILAKYLNKSPSKIEFKYNAHGKPEIKNVPTMQFNLSHSRDFALLVVNQEFPIGIDLEYFSARPYEGIGKHIFSMQENHELSLLPKPLKPLGFFHLWAQKEALIKACGLGLSYPTKQLSLPLLPPTMQTIYDPLHEVIWKIHSFMPEVGCCAAVCFHPAIKHIRYHTLDSIEEL